MDSEVSLFQTVLIPVLRPVLANVPARCPAAMPVQSLACWTAVSLAVATVSWLTAETKLTAPVTVAAE